VFYDIDNYKAAAAAAAVELDTVLSAVDCSCAEV